MDRRRIGKDGKTGGMRRTARGWRKPMAQFGEKVWCHKIGEDGVSSFASRMTQGILVAHRDRTGAVLCITKNGVVRGKKSWTRHTLSYAWEWTNWEGLCGTPWQMVAPQLKLTKKVTTDKGGGGPHCQGLWLKERQRLNPEDSTSCLRTLKLTDTLEAAQDVQRLHRMESRQSHIMTNAERESERPLRES